MLAVDYTLEACHLRPKLDSMWALSADKIRSIRSDCNLAARTPVFTIAGKYETQGWTEWTRGFQHGSALFQFDATGEEFFLDLGRDATLEHMAEYLTHAGVHDHGFNNVSTYGNLLRMAAEGRFPSGPWERRCYALALGCSGATQARRWTRLPGGSGYIYSFNGPHSLFVDTIRSLRSLALAYILGHDLIEENDRRVSLLDRLVRHLDTTAAHSVYYGEGRDAWDKRGRVAHESIFNVNDGSYRCPGTQQGYSPFSTWTRGLAWAICGLAEQLEFLHLLAPAELESAGGKDQIEWRVVRALTATCDYYLENAARDGVPYWDTGAPGIAGRPELLEASADPYDAPEPVDSSAACIAAQGLLRAGRMLESLGTAELARTYWHAGLTIARTLLDDPYLSRNASHQGLLLHSIYHRPKGWDHVPPGRRIPCGESSMWGDYHLRELGLYLQRVADGGVYLTFDGRIRSYSESASRDEAAPGGSRA